MKKEPPTHQVNRIMDLLKKAVSVQTGMDI